jgi:hypothetical protein
VLCFARRLLAALSETMAFIAVDIYFNREASASSEYDQYHLEEALEDPWLLALLTAALWQPKAFAEGLQLENDREKVQEIVLDELAQALDAAWAWVRGLAGRAVRG